MSDGEQERGDERVLRHAERVLYGRLGVGALLYGVFVTLHISAALTGSVQERSALLLGLLIASIVALPRQVVRPQDVERAGRVASPAWMARMKRAQRWLVWVRLGFFLGALFLFFVLPELLGRG